MMDPISMASTTLLSAKCTLCEAIISYVSNVALCKVKYFDALKPMIHLHKLLECAQLHITNA